jgi:hypothetical protein
LRQGFCQATKGKRLISFNFDMTKFCTTTTHVQKFGTNVQKFGIHVQKFGTWITKKCHIEEISLRKLNSPHGNLLARMLLYAK